ncbi:DUF2278 family protein [Candidatus Sororendozoicomonas aggregata]|uniref:DUF2278 family protein n=1 Tax=Candidatus Sororendozoicomonas aggregata TaxID=3073239 RepID=UPI002ED44B43
MIDNYGVLRANVEIDKENHYSERSHETRYNLITKLNGEEYQVNIDVQSRTTPNVRVYVDTDFDHKEYISYFKEIEKGFTDLNSGHDNFNIDLIHKPLFDINKLDADCLSADEIEEVLDSYLLGLPEVFVFGRRYRSEEYIHTPPEMLPYGLRRYKHYPGALPNRGVDMVHLNQGIPNSDHYHHYNGAYQDGAMFINRSDHYVAVFFAFQQQCLKTDLNGECLTKN